MSRGFAPTVIPPRLLSPRTCTPATPINADSTGTFTIASASSIARRIELTASSRFTIWPLRQPFDSAAPSAANFAPPSSSISPISAQVFVLPTSSATTYRSFFANSAAPCFPARLTAARLPRFPYQMFLVPMLRHFLRRFRRRLPRGRGNSTVRGCMRRSLLPSTRVFRIHNRLAAESQVHGLHSSRRSAPLPDIVEQRAVLGFEIAVAEMDQQRSFRLAPIAARHAARQTSTGEPRKSRAQILGVGEIHFAHLLRRSRMRGLNLLDESREEPQTLFALVDRHFRADAAHHRKMKIAFQRPLQNHSIGIDKARLAAFAQKCDRSALGDINFNLIGKRAPHRCLLHPRQRFDLLPALVQRNAQHAVIAIGCKNPQHIRGLHVTIPGNVNLVGL